MRCEELEDLYRADRKRFINRVSRAVGGKANAEDVVQEAFTRALEYYRSYNPRKPLLSWFNTILNNCVRDFKSEERLGGMVGDPLSEPLDKTMYDKQMVETLLKEVQDHDRAEVLRLYFIEGMTSREISKVTEFTPYQCNTTAMMFRRKMWRRYPNVFRTDMSS